VPGVISSSGTEKKVSPSFASTDLEKSMALFPPVVTSGALYNTAPLPNAVKALGASST